MMLLGASVEALAVHSPFFLHVQTASGKDDDIGGFGNNVNDLSVYPTFHDSSCWRPCYPDINQHRSVSINQCKDSLHRTSDIRVITWFFQSVLRASQCVHPRQVPLPCIDPLSGSNLSIVLVFDVNPLS
jgi:hypothetical protein